MLQRVLLNLVEVCDLCNDYPTLGIAGIYDRCSVPSDPVDDICQISDLLQWGLSTNVHAV